MRTDRIVLRPKFFRLWVCVWLLVMGLISVAANQYLVLQQLDIAHQRLANQTDMIQQLKRSDSAYWDTLTAWMKHCDEKAKALDGRLATLRGETDVMGATVNVLAEDLAQRTQTEPLRTATDTAAARQAREDEAAARVANGLWGSPLSITLERRDMIRRQE